MMDIIRKLVLLAFIPSITSIALYITLKSDRFKKLNPMYIEIGAGVLFGIIAIHSTEAGVQYQGAIVNARDVSPLCAGLFFGPLAGIISSVIAAVERWLCVYWGGGYYTRMACSVATLLTGFIAAFLRKYIYEDQIPEWLLAMFSGVFCETLDMLLIFLTNMKDLETAFVYVRVCSAPMIISCGLSIGFTALIIERIERDTSEDTQVSSVTTQLQVNLVLAVICGCLFTSLMTYMIQNQICKNDTNYLLDRNIVDVSESIEMRINNDILSYTKDINEDYFIDMPDSGITWLADYYGVAEINVIDSNGIVIDSNIPENIGFDLTVSKQQVKFLYLINDLDQLYGMMQYSDYPHGELRKYVGVHSYGGGVVQVGFNYDEYIDLLYNTLRLLTGNHRVGERGNILLLDPDGNILSNNSFYKNMNIEDLGTALLASGKKENEVHQNKIFNQDYYYMYENNGDYYTLAYLPVQEAEFSMMLSTYMNIFMQIIMFGLLFVIVYFIAKARIVDKVNDINDSLNQITEGDLTTVVDVRSSQEFISLSDGINVTVDALKQLIKEANERIDSELRYAKEIQFSALPSTFPAFPDLQAEFDIYALMDPARQVGGDFYDFYLLDDHTLAFLIADVSGKGIPASLFMMRAKTTIKTYAENGMAVADVFTNANNQLCECNDADMFGTAWMGILDLSDGTLKYANAGHNRPLIKRKDGQFEYLQGPAGFVLAGMEGIHYKEQELVLQPGDEIFLYTDGVVEATDVDKQLYGDDRLLACVNEHNGEDSRQLCDSIKEDVDRFYEGAEQFDDITEVSLQFKAYHNG